MIHATRSLLLCAAGFLVAACAPEPTGRQFEGETPLAGYRNPVLDADFPDPSILRAPDRLYYAHATQTVRGPTALNIQVASSRDLVNWAHLGDALPTRPAWSTKVWNFWAPHVIRAPEQDRYIMYFSARHDTTGTMCIGAATSSRPDGPFTDAGSPLACGQGFTHIDPMAFDDSATGRKFLYWGSDFAPIVARELDETRLRFAPGSEPVVLLHPDAGRPYDRLIEAPWVIRRGSWYYLFYSGDDCCGTNPRYAVMVARARSPLGPFERIGTAKGMVNNAILEPGGDWKAPGHNAIIRDNAGDDWIVYHAIDPANPFQAGSSFVRRPMLLDRIRYDVDGWPYVNDGKASRSLMPKPVTDVLR